MADQLTEREMLIKHGEILKTICINLNELKKENSDEHLALNKKLDDIEKDKVSNSIFFWVVGFIIIALVSLTAYTGALKNDVVKNGLRKTFAFVPPTSEL